MGTKIGPFWKKYFKMSLSNSQSRELQIFGYNELLDTLNMRRKLKTKILNRAFNWGLNRYFVSFFDN